MNSIAFSPSLQTFTQKHGTNARSHRILSLRRNFLTAKSCKMQPMHSKPLLVAALRGSKNNAAPEPNSMPPSPLLDLVHKFYMYLNSKDVRRLEKLFDPACVIEDEAYYRPLEGKVSHLTTYFISSSSSIRQNI